jgi:hypothetical protein
MTDVVTFMTIATSVSVAVPLFLVWIRNVGIDKHQRPDKDLREV